ncbi:MAG: DUF2779 domain-containing protein [Dehalococcoidales bacterium]|nr:DUF2779 domain-containing protein [Dehalococcoidales bacterium]
MKSLLTKSRYICGLRCPKLLWTYCHAPKTIPEPTQLTQFYLTQGTDIGILAQQLFPKGRAIRIDNFSANLRDSQTFMSLGIPLFEASFLSDRIYARADILEPTEEGAWNLYEVKSSTAVKEEHLNDISFQKYVFEKAGLNIKSCSLIVINNHYVFDGTLDIRQLFKIENVDEKIEALLPEIPRQVSSMLDIMDRNICPQTKIHPLCKGNRYCEMLEVCTGNLPKNNVTSLVFDSENNGIALLNKGITAIKDIPDGFELPAKQQIQRDCIITNKAFIDKENIKSFLDGLTYPLYALDFETVQGAVPLYSNSRPYQSVPFQYSLHVKYHENDELHHYEFLHDGPTDPRPALLKQLKSDIGTEGTILVYYDEFEKGRLKEAATDFPENKEWIEAVISRIKDLFLPFKAFHYYHPDQCGSVSLKKVLPALTGVSYQDMEINKGEVAPAAFMKCYFDDLTTETERSHIRTELLKYCSLDTEGLFLIIQELRRLIEKDEG